MFLLAASRLSEGPSSVELRGILEKHHQIFKVFFWPFRKNYPSFFSTKAWAIYIKHRLTVNVNGGLDTEASQSDLNWGRWKMDSLSDSKASFGIAGQKRDMNLYTLKWSGNKPTKAHSSYKTVPLVLSDILPRSEPTRNRGIQNPS